MTNVIVWKLAARRLHVGPNTLDARTTQDLLGSLGRLSARLDELAGLRDDLEAVLAAASRAARHVGLSLDDLASATGYTAVSMGALLEEEPRM